jgi:hypothetical protein
MAYIIGLCTPEEKAILQRRGWEFEKPPDELLPEVDYEPSTLELCMVYVDRDMFAIMSGPDWDFGDVGGPEGVEADLKPVLIDGVPSRVIATFQPQAWVNDLAVGVDPEGEVTFDVTNYVDLDKLPNRDSYASDDLRDAPTAPNWIKAWHGPFCIAVEVVPVEDAKEKK